MKTCCLHFTWPNKAAFKLLVVKIIQMRKECSLLQVLNLRTAKWCSFACSCSDRKQPINEWKKVSLLREKRGIHAPKQPPILWVRGEKYLSYGSPKLHDISCKSTSAVISGIAVLHIFQTNKFQYQFSPRLGQKQIPENINFIENR